MRNAVRGYIFILTLMMQTVVLADDANKITISSDVLNYNFLIGAMVSLVAASLGGAARTSIILKDPSIQTNRTSLKHFVSDQIGAMVAGFVAFNLSEMNDLTMFAEIITIIISGYLGSLLLDSIGKGLMDRLSSLIGTNDK